MVVFCYSQVQDNFICIDQA